MAPAMTMNAMTPMTMPTTVPVLGPLLLLVAIVAELDDAETVGVTKTVLTVPSAVTVWTAVGGSVVNCKMNC